MTRLVFSDAGKAQLVAAIAAAPAGRLSIPRLRDALVSQADVLDALKALVDDGTLDRATLRPTKRDTKGASGTARKAPGASSSGDASRDTVSAPATTPPAEDVPSPPAADPSGKALFDAVKAECDRRGLDLVEAGVQIFNCRARLHQVKVTNPRRKVTAKIEAWLAASRHEHGSTIPREASGADLVARFEAAAAADPTIDRRAFAIALGGFPGTLHSLKRSTMVRAKTLRRFEALMADPPRCEPEATKPAPVAAPRGTPASGAAPTAPARDPAIEGQRLAAKIRRSHTETATRILDGLEKGETSGGAISPSIAASMREIQATREAQARAEDPVEKAKLILRRRNRVVYDAPVANGPQGHFVCSGLKPWVTREQLLAEAEKVSGQRLTGEAA